LKPTFFGSKFGGPQMWVKGGHKTAFWGLTPPNGGEKRLCNKNGGF